MLPLPLSNQKGKHYLSLSLFSSLFCSQQEGQVAILDSVSNVPISENFGVGSVVADESRPLQGSHGGVGLGGISLDGPGSLGQVRNQIVKEIKRK